MLQLADAIACEETRHTQQLLRAYGIDGKPLLPLHEHNEAEAAQAVLERLRQGQRVAYVSDAGTPAVSDPGARLVAAVRAAGLAASPLPGASSVTAAPAWRAPWQAAMPPVSCSRASCRRKRRTRHRRAAPGRRAARRVVLLEAPTAWRHWPGRWPCWANAR
ncbi:MAG: SAM-dependent methyltransferase [Burkholderiaceae bacterium]